MKMLVIAAVRGGVKCSSACPFYTETGRVKGYNGPLATHCRMTMHEWMVNCDRFNPCRIETIDVNEAEWKNMQKAIGRRAKRQRKLYPEDHEEIHPVGWKPKQPNTPSTH